MRVRHGIYATRTRLADGREIAGVTYVGRRPTIAGACEERLEVHLLDFDEDLYGQTLETDLIAFLRPDERFDGLEAMTVQMEHDKANARALLLQAWADRRLPMAPFRRCGSCLSSFSAAKTHVRKVSFAWKAVIHSFRAGVL